MDYFLNKAVKLQAEGKYEQAIKLTDSVSNLRYLRVKFATADDPSINLGQHYSRLIQDTSYR